MLELMEEYSELFPEKNVDGTLLQEVETSTEDAALVTQFKGRCHKCGEYGHMAKNCTEHTSGERENGDRRNGRETRECYYCHKIGDLKRDCRKLKAKMASEENEEDNEDIGPVVYEDVEGVVLATVEIPQMVGCCHSCKPVLHGIPYCKRITEGFTESNIIKHTEPIDCTKIEAHGKEESHGKHGKH